MTTVLVVDSDVGFVLWLGLGLNQAGYAAFPAQSVPRAKAFLDEVKIAVDLLIVNSALRDAAGLVESLRGLYHHLKVVAVIDNEVDAGKIPDADLRCRKPEGTDESTRQDLIEQIEKVSPPFAAN